MRIVVSPRAAADLERLRAFLAEANLQASERAIGKLVTSIQSLRDFPGRGRPIAGLGMRELIVPFGKAGYVVRYYRSARRDSIVILRVWHSREARR